jgi:SAM-dependent methyltransferase
VTMSLASPCPRVRPLSLPVPASRPPVGKRSPPVYNSSVTRSQFPERNTRKKPMAHSNPAPAGVTALPEDQHWWFATRTRSLLGILDRHVRPGAGGRRVLDVGCGAGNMFHHLARYGQVEGVDDNPLPLAVARSRGYTVQQASGERMPVPDARFDLVAALDVIEHVDDDAAVLRECYRACRPGGWIVVTVPAFAWLWSHNDELNCHKRRYTRAELTLRLQAVGFSVRRATYNNFFIFPMAAALIVLRRGAAREPELATPSAEGEAYQVEMEPASRPLNILLTAVGRLEAWALKTVNMPAGTSLIAVGQRPPV